MKKLKMLLCLVTALLLALSLTACGGGGEETEETAAAPGSALAGYYPIYKMTVGGNTLSANDLALAGLSEGMYLKLEADGTGEQGFGGEAARPITFDGEKGVMVFGSGEEVSFTADGNRITVFMPDQDMELVYEKEAESGNAAVAGSLADAFGVGQTSAAQVELPSVWYGWLSFSEFDGIENKDEIYDAWAYVDTDSSGRSFFEIYQDGYPDDAFMSMYADIQGNKIIPDIGEDDAWASDTYLLAENADQYVGELGEDGVLRFDYFFIHHSREYGYRVQMYLRVDGTEWDEEKDILPPRYDEYKAALGGAAEEPAEAAASSGGQTESTGFGGQHSSTVDEFMTGIEATFTFELPDSNWVTETPDRTVYIYNMKSLDVTHSAAPRIQFELKENLDKINFYKDDFENLKEIDPRTIGGILMEGRTYRNVGMDWTEYYGELPSGVWVCCKISGPDISEGSEGARILDSVKIS